eukprot:m.294315 g.294315  ORF g.294315 m.294315 type:complete len:333 (+) comp15849_c1_seq1:108-1106(+)
MHTILFFSHLSSTHTHTLSYCRVFLSTSTRSVSPSILTHQTGKLRDLQHCELVITERLKGAKVATRSLLKTLLRDAQTIHQVRKKISQVTTKRTKVNKSLTQLSTAKDVDKAVALQSELDLIDAEVRTLELEYARLFKATEAHKHTHLLHMLKSSTQSELEYHEAGAKMARAKLEMLSQLPEEAPHLSSRTEYKASETMDTIVSDTVLELGFGYLFTDSFNKIDDQLEPTRVKSVKSSGTPELMRPVSTYGAGLDPTQMNSATAMVANVSSSASGVSELGQPLVGSQKLRLTARTHPPPSAPTSKFRCNTAPIAPLSVAGSEVTNAQHARRS